MTDPAPASPVEPEGLVVVVAMTPEFAGELLERVETLEASVPATVPADGADPVTLASLSDRLSRHRAELESIKSWLNGLSAFLGLPGPTTTTDAAPASTTPGSYQ